MIQIKKICMRIFLILEMAFFGYVYFFGQNGIVILQRQCILTTALESNIVTIKNEIKQLEEEIHAWQTDDFYKEKVAREQLQMARPGDEIFYIGT